MGKKSKHDENPIGTPENERTLPHCFHTHDWIPRTPLKNQKLDKEIEQKKPWYSLWSCPIQ